MAPAPQIHLICNAHLDPIWQWRWEEGLTEAIATFEVAADLLDEYPEFVFNHNESLLYEWTLQYRPDLFERIKAHVKTGRWVITGGWFLQPDCNLPSGESFIRQASVGLRFFQEHFGVTPKVAYNLDPFGHHGNMPQILKKTGFEMYVHFRPGPPEKEIDGFLYRWRGIDGSEVDTLRPPCGWYNVGNPQLLREKITAMRALAQEKGCPVTAFWGMGDHGGGATRADLDAIREVVAEWPEVIHGSFEDYFEAAKPALAAGPVVTGELQKCFTGCYTSVIGTKQRNRKGEAMLMQAERYATLAWWLYGKVYPKTKLEQAWKRVLFNQFHDILPGSSIREGFEGSIELYGEAFTLLREVLVDSQMALIQSAKRRDPMPICILNPLPTLREVPVEVDFLGAAHPVPMQGKYFVVRGLDGAEVTSQSIFPAPGVNNWRLRFLVEAKLPALGMAEYQIEMKDGAWPEQKPALAMTDEDGKLSFINEFYTIAFDKKSGLVSSLVSGEEFMAKPGGALLVREDILDAWGGNQPAYGAVAGEFTAPSDAELNDILGGYDDTVYPVVRVTEAGPVATRVEVVQAYKRSVARLRYTLYANHPQIHVEVLVNWNERRRALQWSFPTTMDSPDYTIEIPHGRISRPAGNGEEPCGRWVMLTSADGGKAFGLVNDGPGGLDIAGGEIRQTFVRTPQFASGGVGPVPDRMGEHMDLGEHIYHFVIRAGAAPTVSAAMPMEADALAMPPAVHVHFPYGPASQGMKPGAPAVEVNGENIHLATVKQSDEGEDLVIRLVETAGGDATCRLTILGFEKTIALSFTPFELKTLRIQRKGRTASWKETDLLEC